MNTKQTYNLLGNVDIYLIDQILKGRFQEGESILDAGCGNGRNLKWFYQNNHPIAGIDINGERIEIARANYPEFNSKFTIGSLDNLTYDNSHFDHILCSAVLHFSNSEKHFHTIFSELIRVLKGSGTLFLRSASDIGLDSNNSIVKDNQSGEAGGLLMSRSLITELLQMYPVVLLEPVKTTNVQDLRAMTTLVFQKLSY
ncbi:class I SAM-dependent methyltransferase [Nonlabens antarcticus]|uniref:class I SAM-dependent methyltransferase n=1 Tax=Nonlabens antarcticus TaxID=392714 RepID=UPI0018919E87|nr:class I SAM-dependent methyltransferase [Nonlabens antarcticus]